MNDLHAGVAVIIRNNKGQVLLLKRGEKSRDEVGKWENPGGEIKPNEDLEQACKREVFEELGIKLTKIQFMYKDVFVTDHKDRWRVCVFEARTDDKPTIKELGKHDDWKFVDICDLSKIPLASYTRRDFRRIGLLK